MKARRSLFVSACMFMYVSVNVAFLYYFQMVLPRLIYKKFNLTGLKNWCNVWKPLSCVWLFVTPWTIQSMEFSRPECSGWPIPSPGDLPNPATEPMSPALQADSLPDEPPGKPKNPGVGSLSLLQGIFPTQESNWGLLHCRQILYQLSYQGSPCSTRTWVQIPAPTIYQLCDLAVVQTPSKFCSQ